MPDYDMPGFGREIETEVPKQVEKPKPLPEPLPEMTHEALCARLFVALCKEPDKGKLYCEFDRRRGMGIQIAESMQFFSIPYRNDRKYPDHDYWQTLDKVDKQRIGYALDALCHTYSYSVNNPTVEEVLAFIRKNGPTIWLLGEKWRDQKRLAEQTKERKRRDREWRGREALEEHERAQEQRRQQATPTAAPATVKPRAGELLPKLPLPAHLRPKDPAE